MSHGYRPWVGDNYGDGLNGVKLLLLGESHYVQPAFDTGADLTINSVKENALGRRHAFFTKTMKLVLGPGAEAEGARQHFWHRVAFYNYVQVEVGATPRKRPMPEMWDAAKAPFLELLETLKPDCVLVLGKEAWAHLPPPAAHHTTPHEMKEFATGYGRVLATYASHPSSPRFTYGPFVERIAEMQAMARRGVGRS